MVCPYGAPNHAPPNPVQVCSYEDPAGLCPALVKLLEAAVIIDILAPERLVTDGHFHKETIQ